MGEMMYIWKPGPKNSKVTIRGIAQWDYDRAYVFDDTGKIVDENDIPLGVEKVLYELRGKRVKIDIQEI
jgi:hypothetical protein